MVRKNQKRLTTGLFLALLMTFLPAAAQNGNGQQDSLVRLVKASSLRLIEESGEKFRKAVDATFLHNGTYLICDTALWNVDKQVINSEGHVQIIQDETLLTSDRLDYYIDRDLAEFRGGVVQLTDKDGNVLRTRNLDYNTKDSVAVFRGGAAMRDRDGQIIESESGKYDSKSSEFFFDRRVNMFTDSVFVRTESLIYEGNTSKARFIEPIDFFKDGNMLSSDRGYYEREQELFFFTGRVHGLSENQESWSDSLYFYRLSGNVLLIGNAQVQDTTRNVSAVARNIHYEDSLSRVTLWGKAAVAMKTQEENQPSDTIYFGADTIVYETVRRCDVPEDEVKAAKERLTDMNTDPVREYRAKAAEAAREAARQAAQASGNLPPGQAGPGSPGRQSPQGQKDSDGAAGKVPGGDRSEGQVPGQQGPDGTGQPGSAQDGSGTDDLPEEGRDSSVTAGVDSLGTPGIQLDSLGMPLDSLAAQVDSLVPPPDTTRIDFVRARGNVRVFRSDIQVSCDSMRYCALDSIARFYLDPIVWNDGNRQYSSDSLFVLVRNSSADRANLLSNAFIITQEDSICFDQIKATEVMAYFDTTAALKRFDALGGASALFYLEENETLATVNKVECKMLSAWFKEGTIDKVYYFDQPHNDASPVAQMLPDERRMKGFNWSPERRPAGKRDITDLRVRVSERAAYEAREKASFPETDRYFPGYMQGIYRSIAERDSLNALPRPPKPADGLEADSGDIVAGEEGSGPEDGAGQTGTGEKNTGGELSGEGVPGGAEADSLSMAAARDSLSVKSDSLSLAVDSLARSTPESEKARERKARSEARKAKAQARKAAREARIAELDARDAARAEAKAEKQAARARAAKRRVLEARAAKAAKEQAKLEKYIEKYRKKKAREDARKAGIRKTEKFETD